MEGVSTVLYAAAVRSAVRSTHILPAGSGAGHPAAARTPASALLGIKTRKANRYGSGSSDNAKGQSGVLLQRGQQERLRCS
jgi:hypothetical protein